MAQIPLTGPTGGSSFALKITCYGAAAALCAVTVAANLKFGLTLGSTPEEKAIYAIASVAADIFKCTTVVVVIRLWQRGERMLACVGTIRAWHAWLGHWHRRLDLHWRRESTPPPFMPPPARSSTGGPRLSAAPVSSSRWSNVPGHQRSSRPNSLVNSSRLQSGNEHRPAPS